MGPNRRPLDELRGAVARGDGAAVICALGLLDLADVAQVAGEGVLLALAENVAGARELARRCTDVLRERGWEGDDDLAALLSASFGEGPVSELRPLPIELDELSFILEGDGSSGDGRIDLVTGQVWPEFAIDYAEETGEDLGDVHDPDAGSMSAARALETAIGTWKISSPAWKEIERTFCPLRSQAMEPFVASEMSSTAGPRIASASSVSARSASVDERAPG